MNSITTAYGLKGDVTIEAANVQSAGFGIRAGALALSLLCMAPCHAQQLYTLTKIPAPAEYPGSSPLGYGINNEGEVVGTVTGQIGVQSPAFLYSKGVTRLLPSLVSSGYYANAYAINQAGQIAGDSENLSAVPRAVLWQGVSTPGDLGSACIADGVTFGPSQANAINSSGVAVGTTLGADCGSGTTDTHAAVFSGGAVTDLGTLGGNTSKALGINDSGITVGDAAGAGQNYTHAFYYDGTMHDIGTLGGGLSSSATAINSSGVIVGHADTTANPGGEEPFSWSGGVMTDLGNLGGTAAGANAINSSGQIVGWTVIAGGYVPFVVINGVMSNLNTLLTGPLASSVKLYEPTAINDGGQIVAYAYTANNVIETYILTPVAPAVTPLVAGTLGANGWYVTATTLSWHVTGSPKPTTSGCGKVTVPNTIGTTYTCSATNQYGTASNPVTIKKDTAAPSVRITKPASGATYNLNQKVAAAYKCADGISGVETCTGTVADGADFPTSVAGSQTFSVTAIDNAGNTTTKSVTYSVQ
jgi:probable HAF family extracellular repeat protein